MAVSRRKGGKADIHNEFDTIKHPDRDDVRKKCKHCGKELSRNNKTLIKHINDHCPTATNKYNNHGMISKASKKNNSCNWECMTSPSASITPQEIAQQQFEQLIDESEKNINQILYSLKFRKVSLTQVYETKRNLSFRCVSISLSNS